MILNPIYDYLKIIKNSIDKNENTDNKIKPFKK